MLGLLGLRILEATAADIADLGEEHGHRVLRVCGKGTKIALVPLPPAVGRAIDGAVGSRARGRSCLTATAPGWTGTRPPSRLRHLAETAGIQVTRAHPHMLRHTFITTAFILMRCPPRPWRHDPLLRAAAWRWKICSSSGRAGRHHPVRARYRRMGAAMAVRRSLEGPAKSHENAAAGSLRVSRKRSGRDYPAMVSGAHVWWRRALPDGDRDRGTVIDGGSGGRVLV
jgi:integrase